MVTYYSPVTFFARPLDPRLPAPFPVMPSPVAVGIGPVGRWRIWGIFVERHMVVTLINSKNRMIRPLRIDEKTPVQAKQEHHQAQTKHQLFHIILPLSLHRKGAKIAKVDIVSLRQERWDFLFGGISPKTTRKLRSAKQKLPPLRP